MSILLKELSKRGGKVSEEDANLMNELVKSGYSYTVVAEKFDVSVQVVSSVAKKPDNVISATGFAEIDFKKKIDKELIVTYKGHPVGKFVPNSRNVK